MRALFTFAKSQEKNKFLKKELKTTQIKRILNPRK
jgi:hypothetical protein